MTTSPEIASYATSVHAEWLGRLDYAEAWELQRLVHQEVVQGNRPNTFLLCEHPDVITIGRNARNDANLLASREALQADGYQLFDVDRGGDVTYHGPGQLVGYPIIRLSDFREDLGWYMRSLEEVIIRSISALGLAGERRSGMSGVWCGENKICAIGIRASRWVTMHGFALNVSTNLKRFDSIVPCGIVGHGVTSVMELRGEAPSLEEIARLVASEWDGVFAGSAQL